MSNQAPTDQRLLRRTYPLRSLIALIVAACLAACSDSSSSPSESANEIVIGTPTSFDGVNELLQQGSAFNAAILRHMFLWLADETLEPGAEGPVFEPRVASSWSFSDDRRQLTFTIAENAQWSDGVPITATDVRFTWEAQTAPEVAYIYAEIKDGIVDVEVLSDKEVRFHFDQPRANSFVKAIDGGILPSHVWSKLPFDQWRDQPEWFEDKLVTSGPYRLEVWQPQQRLVLAATERPWEAPARIERVIFAHIEEPASRLSRFLAGETDVLYGVSPSSAETIDARNDLQLYRYPSRQFTLIFWNTERPFFDDARVRRALAHAVDREQIVEVLWGGLAQPHESLVSSWHWSHSGLAPLSHDPKQAAELLAQAGWTEAADGIRQREGTRFSFELTTNPGNQERWDAMQMIKEDLARVGIEVLTRRIEFQQLSALNFAHDFDATVTAFSMDTSLDLRATLHSDSIEAGYNFGSFRSQDADAAMDAILELQVLEDAKPLVARIEHILKTEQPFLFLWEPMQLLGANRRVEVETDLLSPFARLHRWKLQSTN